MVYSETLEPVNITLKAKCCMDNAAVKIWHIYGLYVTLNGISKL
jgi:hypothetical protein